MGKPESMFRWISGNPNPEETTDKDTPLCLSAWMSFLFEVPILGSGRTRR